MAGRTAGGPDGDSDPDLAVAMIALAIVVAVMLLLAWFEAERTHCQCCSRGYALFEIRGPVGSIRAYWGCWREHRRQREHRGGAR